MHYIDNSKGFHAYAQAAGTAMPWHGIVNEYLLDTDTPEEAAKKSGLDFSVEKVPVIYTWNNETRTFDNRSVLVRSDTGAALSVMSESHYVPAQPIDLIRGLYEVIQGTGFKIDVIMALKDGKVINALCRRETEPGQIGDDIIHPYLSLRTSFDGTFARTASLTAIREVCWNTVNYSISRKDTKAAKQRNSREFTIEKANDLFDKLGEFDEAFANYMEISRAMAAFKVKDSLAGRFFAKLYAPDIFENPDAWQKSKMDEDKISTNKKNVIGDLLEFYKDSPGSQLESADGTLYGLFNAVTFYQDHEARTKGNKRFESATLGNGAKMKESALELAASLVA